MTDHRSDSIQLRGVRVVGVHGVLEEEKGRAQPFEVDLDLHLDLRRAGASDVLADTVDYGSVAESVAATVAGAPSELLEHLAERIARAAVAAAESRGTTAAVSSVTVTVRKLRPPVPVDLAHTAVSIHRGRSELVPVPGRAPDG